MDHQVERALRRCMTVRDLQDALEGMDGDSKVLFVCDFGDYSNTRQALPVQEVIDTLTSDLAATDYSQSGVRLVPEGDEDADGGEPVVILQ